MTKNDISLSRLITTRWNRAYFENKKTKQGIVICGYVMPLPCLGKAIQADLNRTFIHT